MKIQRQKASFFLDNEVVWWQGLKGLPHLENGIKRKPSVQMLNTSSRTRGCDVTLIFAEKSDPQIRKDIAEMLLAAFEKRGR